MDQKLFLAVISTVRLDAEVLVEKWRELFLGMCMVYTPPSIHFRSFPLVYSVDSFIHPNWGENKYRLTGTATDQDKSPTKRAIVEHVAKLKRSMGIGGVKQGKVKVKVEGDEVQEEEEEDDGLGNFGKSGKKEKMKKKMKGTVTSSGDPTRLRGKGRQGKGSVSSRSTRDMTDDELDDEHVLGESRIKNEDAEYASLPSTAMMADDDTPCPTPRSTKVWGSIPWMFDEDDEGEAETERDDCNGAGPLPQSVEETPTKILRPLTTLPLLSSSSTKEDDTPRSTKRSKTTHQEKSSPGIITSTATFPKNTSSSSTPTAYSTMLSPPNPSSSATTTIQEKEELDKQQDPNANSHSNDLFVSPFWETAQAESTATSTGESSSSAKLMKKKKMKEREKKRSYHIVDVDSAYCSRGNKKVKRSNDDDDDDDDVGGGSSSSSKVGGRGTRKKRIPLAVLEDYPVGQ